MKRLLKYILSPLLVVAVGCSDFGDTDVNPNASPTPLTSALLTNALTTLGGSTTGGANFNAGLYAQYFSETQYTDASLYSNQDVDWAGELAGNIFDLQNIININTNEETKEYAALVGSNANQIAIARILKAYRFSILTDRYGDMPYFDALQEKTEPTFTPQKDIYYDLFKELKEAVAQFDDGETVRGDILFSGNVAKWQKFANSLRLILALRISEVDPAKGEAEFREAFQATGGVITSNDDNAVLAYPGGAFQNPWFGLGADQGISETVAAFVMGEAVSGDGVPSGIGATGVTDRRRFAFGSANEDGEIRGVPYGLTRDDAVQWIDENRDWSLILTTDLDPTDDAEDAKVSFRAENSRLFVLTAADVTLARAEAAFRGWSDDLETFAYDSIHNIGILMSWQQWGVIDEDAPNFNDMVDEYITYINDDNIDLTPNDVPVSQTETEERLGIQRWVTFFPNGPQGWSEWRRTGYPELVPTTEAFNTSKEIPIRFPFPSVEYNYNRSNVEAAVSRMGQDRDSTPVWWDVD